MRYRKWKCCKVLKQLRQLLQISASISDPFHKWVKCCKWGECPDHETYAPDTNPSIFGQFGSKTGNHRDFTVEPPQHLMARDVHVLLTNSSGGQICHIRATTRLRDCQGGALAAGDDLLPRYRENDSLPITIFRKYKILYTSYYIKIISKWYKMVQ